MARNMFELLVKGDGVEVKNDLPQKIVDQIYDEFDKLDGKPTKKQLEAERKKQEAVRKRAEQAEIEELQKQIAAARQANRNQEMRSGAQSQAAASYAAPSVNNEGKNETKLLMSFKKNKNNLMTTMKMKTQSSAFSASK